MSLKLTLEKIMKRFITLLMAAVLVVMAAVNFSVGDASAASMETFCQQEISRYPFLKEDPYFMEDCGPYIDTTSIKIVDIGLVDFCTYETENYPLAKEDPYFKMECSDALKTAEACNEIFEGSKNVFEQLDPTVDPGQFLDYCDKLDRYGILTRKF